MLPTKLRSIGLFVLLFQSGFVFSQLKDINEAGKPIFIITNDLAQYAINHIQFNAEVISKKRKVGFNVYFNKGMSDVQNPDTYKRRESTMNTVTNGDGFYKVYYTGADIKIYPKIDAKKVKYFYSFGIEKGESSCRIVKENTMISMPGYYQGNTYYYYSYSVNTTQTSTRYADAFWGFHHKQGCLWTITKWMYLVAEANIGVTRFVDPDSQREKLKSNSIKYGIGLHLGFAF